MKTIAASLLAVTLMASASFTGGAFASPFNAPAPGVSAKNADVLLVKMTKKKMRHHNMMKSKDENKSM